MYTAVDQDTILFQRINDSTIKSAINGTIYKNERKPNSKLRDVVINSVTITGSESVIQSGVANVNFHAPNLPDGLPDHLFFNAMTALGKQVLTEFYTGSYYFYTEVPGIMVKDKATGEWFLNFRIRFSFHNT